MPARERCPLARVPTIALLSCSLSPHLAQTLPRRAALWSLDPPALCRSLAALTLTPSLFPSPSPLRLSPLPLLPLPPSSLTSLPASLPQISRLHANPEVAVTVLSQRRKRRRFLMQLIVSAGDSSTVTITGKVRRRSFGEIRRQLQMGLIHTVGLALWFALVFWYSCLREQSVRMLPPVQAQSLRRLYPWRREC
jgi:hypothetical protein